MCYIRQICIAAGSLHAATPDLRESCPFPYARRRGWGPPAIPTTGEQEVGADDFHHIFHQFQHWWGTDKPCHLRGKGADSPASAGGPQRGGQGVPLPLLAPELPTYHLPLGFGVIMPRSSTGSFLEQSTKNSMALSNLTEVRFVKFFIFCLFFLGEQDMQIV